MNWFYKQSDRELGPVSAATLQELAACGVVAADTLVRKDNSAEWIAYAEASIDETNAGEEVNPVDASVLFHCQGCGQKISAGQEDVGKQADCPACGTTVTIPQMSLRPASPKTTVPDASSILDTQSAQIVPGPSAPPPLKAAPPLVPAITKISASPTPASPPPISNQAPSTSPATMPSAGKKRHLKPVLIGCGAALLVGCIVVFGAISAIVGAVNQTASENTGGKEAPTSSQTETVVERLPPFDPNTWNKMYSVPPL